MLGHKTGVAKNIQAFNQRLILLTVMDSLSLSVNDTTKTWKLLSDTKDTAKEIISLIIFSPKRENLLGEKKKTLRDLNLIYVEGSLDVKHK